MELRTTFDRAATSYHQARPTYPAGLYEDLLAVTGVSRASVLVEVGCGTGIATLPLAEQRLKITCLELGQALAQEAAKNLAAFPDVRIEPADFELWQPDRPYDLLYSATAWHWIDKSKRFALAARALKSDGYIAFWSAQHVFPTDGDSLFRDLQDVYNEIGNGAPAEKMNWPAPGDLPDQVQEIRDSGLFDVRLVEHYDWETSYSAESYIDLLLTFSGHIAMQPSNRERLFSAIREKVNMRQMPEIRRHWGCVLHIAQRNSQR